MYSTLCIGITIDDMLSGSRPLVDLYIYIPNWCYTDHLILAVLA